MRHVVDDRPDLVLTPNECPYRVRYRVTKKDGTVVERGYVIRRGRRDGIHMNKDESFPAPAKKNKK